MAFSLQTIRTGLYSFVSGMTNVTTIWYNQNAPRPALPYVTMDIREYEMINRDWIAPLDENCDSFFAGNREFTLVINYYGAGAIEALERLQTLGRSYDVQNQLLNSGVVYVNRVAMTNVAELLDTKWEERYQLEMRFRVSNQGITAPETFNVGSIETVTGTGKVKNESGQVVIEKDFIIQR